MLENGHRARRQRLAGHRQTDRLFLQTRPCYVYEAYGVTSDVNPISEITWIPISFQVISGY